MIQNIKNNYKNIDLINILKIVIIVITAIYVFGNFEPYFEGSDSYLYGVVAKNLTNGIYAISNELFLETERVEFIGENWRKTSENTHVPVAGIGLPIAGAIFYSIANDYGLYYLSPIFTIILLILTERISTKFFGKNTGLVVLLLMSSSNLILRNGINLQTETIFSSFFILGIFYLVKYFDQFDNYKIFLASMFFVISSFIRINGAMIFPVEISIVIGYFLWKKYSSKKQTKNFNEKLKNLDKSKILRAVVVLLIPWVFFFGYWFLSNDIFFGDPLTNYRLESQTFGPEITRDSKISSLLSLDTKNFDNMKSFSKYLLPYQIPAIYNKTTENYEQILGVDWIGFIALMTLGMIMIFSLIQKNHQRKMIIFFLMILGMAWFFSAVTTEERASLEVPGRYMIPVMPLGFMMFGFIISLSYDFLKNKKRILALLLKIGLAIFFITSFYYTILFQDLSNNEFNFTDPKKYEKIYPLNVEGVNPKDVVLAVHTDWPIDYGLTPFRLIEGLPQESIELLKEIVNDEERNVYVFKIPTYISEERRLEQLVSKHGFILEDYSDTFYKLKINDEY